MKKVVLDQSKCVGCGACVAMAPETFDFDDSGLSNVINEEVTNEAISASESCPFSAITIVDEDEDQKNEEMTE